LIAENISSRHRQAAAKTAATIGGKKNPGKNVHGAAHDPHVFSPFLFPFRFSFMLNTLLTLLVFQTLGEGLVYVLSLPVPGPVIGMLLLLFYLIWKKDTAARLAPSASQLLSNMALLFVPACVGI